MALVAVAVFAGLSHVATVQVLSTQQGTAEVINVAGRQRMLSQRITLKAREYERSSFQEHRGRLEDSIALMTQQHETLVNPLPDTKFEKLLSTELEELYVAGGLDGRV